MGPTGMGSGVRLGDGVITLAAGSCTPMAGARVALALVAV